MKIKPSFALPITAALVGGVSTPVFAQSPDRADLMKRADSLLDAKDWAGCEKLYTQAIALDPKEHRAWLDRGMCRIKLGRYAEAIADTSSGLAALPGGSCRWLRRTGSRPARGDRKPRI